MADRRASGRLRRGLERLRPPRPVDGDALPDGLGRRRQMAVPRDEAAPRASVPTSPVADAFGPRRRQLVERQPAPSRRGPRLVRLARGGLGRAMRLPGVPWVRSNAPLGPAGLREAGAGSLVRGLGWVANRNPVYRFVLGRIVARLPLPAKARLAINAACGCVSCCGCGKSCCALAGCLLPLLLIVLFVLMAMGMFAARAPGFVPALYCERYQHQLAFCGEGDMQLQLLVDELPPDAARVYRDVEAKTGVPWFYLAAWEKVATDFGRASNLSGESVPVPADAMTAAMTDLREEAFGDSVEINPDVEAPSADPALELSDEAVEPLHRLRSPLRGGSFGLFLTSEAEYLAYGLDAECGGACNPWDRHDAALMAARSLQAVFAAHLAHNGGSFTFSGTSSEGVAPEQQISWLVGEHDALAAREAAGDTTVSAHLSCLRQLTAANLVDALSLPVAPCAGVFVAVDDQRTLRWVAGPRNGEAVLAVERRAVCQAWLGETDCGDFADTPGEQLQLPGSGTVTDLAGAVALFYDPSAAPPAQVSDWPKLETLFGALFEDPALWGFDPAAYHTVPELGPDGPTGNRVRINAYAATMIVFGKSAHEGWANAWQVTFGGRNGAFDRAGAAALMFWRPAIDALVAELAAAPHKVVLGWQYLAATLHADDAFGCQVQGGAGYVGTASATPGERYPNTVGLLSEDPVRRAQQLAYFDTVAALPEGDYRFVYNGDDERRSPPIPPELATHVRLWSDAHDIDPLLVSAVIWKESRFQADARNKRTNATGLMQLMPGLYRSFGLTEAQALDGATNIQHGSRYLASRIRRFATLEEGIGAYHSGAAWVRRNGLPDDSNARGYALRVRARYLWYLELAGAGSDALAGVGDIVSGCWRFGEMAAGLWADENDDDIFDERREDEGDGEEDGGSSGSGFGLPFEAPTEAPVRRAFGCRESDTSLPGRGSCRHFNGGIDYAAGGKRDVRAAAAGKVVSIVTSGTSARVTIVHDPGYTTVYDRLDAASVRVARSARVRIGQLLGSATAAGLRFETWPACFVWSTPASGACESIDPHALIARGSLAPSGSTAAAPVEPAARMNFCTPEFRALNETGDNCGTASVTLGETTLEVPIVGFCECSTGDPTSERGIELTAAALNELGVGVGDGTTIRLTVVLQPPANAVDWPREVAGYDSPLAALRALSTTLLPAERDFGGAAATAGDLAAGWIAWSAGDADGAPPAGGGMIELVDPTRAPDAPAVTVPASDYMRRLSNLLSLYFAASSGAAGSYFGHDVWNTGEFAVDAQLENRTSTRGADCAVMTIIGAVRWATYGEIVPTVAEVRRAAGNMSSGLTVDQVARAYAHFRVTARKARYLDAEELEAILASGAVFHALTDYGYINSHLPALSGQPGLRAYHAVALYGLTIDSRGQEITVVFDPLFDGRRAGIPDDPQPVAVDSYARAIDMFPGPSWGFAISRSPVDPLASR